MAVADRKTGTVLALNVGRDVHLAWASAQPLSLPLGVMLLFADAFACFNWATTKDRHFNPCSWGSIRAKVSEHKPVAHAALLPFSGRDHQGRPWSPAPGALGDRNMLKD